MPPIYLIARRDYFAYVGTPGFWVSLLLMPLLFAVFAFAPILLLAHAEPPRVIAVLADQPADAAVVEEVFKREARTAARGEIQGYLAAAAPSVAGEAIAAFDAAPDRRAAIAAARDAVRARAPNALRAFPNPSPRYLITPPPAPVIEGLRPYLTGELRVTAEGGVRQLYGVVHVRRTHDNYPYIEYWSINLSHTEPSEIAKGAMRLALRREAFAQRGLDPMEADRLDNLAIGAEQFDPRSSAEEGAVTVRQRAPYWVSLGLAFVLWSVVFSVANMLLTSVIEERSNKILDTVLTSASPLELLIGKLLGIACVSLTLFVVWGAIGGGLMYYAAQNAPDGVFGQAAAAFLDPRLLAAFGVGFVCGYLMYGAIFLALGSLCESAQEAQTLMWPVALVLAAPMLLVAPALDNPSAPLIVAASWFPLFTPFLLLVRAPAGLGWFEIIGMSALMIVSLVIILRLAARVFRAGVADHASFASLRKRVFARKNARPN